MGVSRSSWDDFFNVFSLNWVYEERLAFLWAVGRRARRKVRQWTIIPNRGVLSDGNLWSRFSPSRRLFARGSSILWKLALNFSYTESVPHLARAGRQACVHVRSRTSRAVGV